MPNLPIPVLIESADGQISYDNESQHVDRDSAFYQARYRNLAPSKLHFLTYSTVVGRGDNAGFKGVGGGYIVALDDATVDDDAERGVLYGLAISVQPRRDRNNAPADDAACLVLQNDGTGAATELLYFGRGSARLNREANSAIGIETWSDSAIFATGRYNYGLDFARGAQSVLAKSAIRVPVNCNAMVARKADNTDLQLLSTNADEQVVLAGRVVQEWQDYTPVITSSTGAIASYSIVSGRWVRMNNTVTFNVTLHIVDKGTAGQAMRITLPLPCVKRSTFSGFDTSTGRMLVASVAAGASFAVVSRYDGADPMANGVYYNVSGTYEVA
jgi:hypothetical protein